jgi:hypothetical protein
LGPFFASFTLPYPKQEYIAAYVIKQDTSVEFSNNLRKIPPPSRSAMKVGDLSQ